jgi:hypothetical protein
MCTIIRENYHCSAGLIEDPVLGLCEQGDKRSGSIVGAKSFKLWLIAGLLITQR